jgi:hypothetical protein
MFAHPLFWDQLEKLTMQAQALRQKDLVFYTKKNAT